MAQYATLKAAIQDVIKTNGNEEITGALLQQSLLAMINSLGDGFQFMGVATPSTNPGTPDQNVFYIAGTAGTYSNFSGIVVAGNEIAILKWNGSWVKETTGAATAAQLTELGQEIEDQQYCITVESTLGGFIYYDYDNTTLYFKYLVIKNTITGIYLYLTDGEHSRDQVNSINFAPAGVFYINKGNYSSGASVTLYCGTAFPYENVIILGAAERANRILGGLIGDYAHYLATINNIKNLDLQFSQRKERTFRVSDIGLLSGFYQSDNGVFNSNSNALRSVTKFNVLPGETIRVELNGAGVYLRFLFWNGDTFIATTYLVGDGIITVPENATQASFTLAINFSGWRSYAVADMLDMCVKVTPYNVLFRNDCDTIPSIPKSGIVLENNGAILLAGASFASPANGWFELACATLGQTAINKARDGGISIFDTANEMYAGTLYSQSEFEQFGTLVLMHVWNYDVMNTANIKNKVSDYSMPFPSTASDAAISAAFDYVIKKYMLECYQAKNTSTSRWYNTQSGKPCQIVLCTSWQDNRDKYNLSIRKLAGKWRIPLVTFDENIGFTKNAPFNENGEQISKWYCIPNNFETIDGVVYGWHPARGQSEYIQKKMATIFAEQIK